MRKNNNNVRRVLSWNHKPRPHLAVVVAQILPRDAAKGITLLTNSDDIGTRPSTYHLVNLVTLLLATGVDITGACNY